MLTQFLLTVDSTRRGKHLLICASQTSFFTVLHRLPEQEIALDSALRRWDAFYGPKDGMLVVHFELNPESPGEEAEAWPDKLLTEAIQYYNTHAGLMDLMLIFQITPFQVLFESENSLLKQKSYLPSGSIIYANSDEEFFELTNAIRNGDGTDIF